MTLITIREIVGAPEGAPNAEVSFDHGTPYLATVRDPFGEEEEKLLRWYFEQHLAYPFLDREKASRAAASIPTYGEALFRQVFRELARADYTVARAPGLAGLQFEIEGTPEFHALHWEALKDPDVTGPFALECPFVRKSRERAALKARVRPSPTLNVLVVVARPRGRRDVGYRTITRPLVDSLKKTGLPVRIDILRPGTYEALARHLDEMRSPEGGFYHIVHFDAHGALMKHEQYEASIETDRFTYRQRGFDLEEIKPFEGRRAFLFLEGSGDRPVEPVEASELAGLLSTQQVPVVVLNACQSGMEVGAPKEGAPETGVPKPGASETSLANRLIAGGVQVAVGMSYSVTVSAAELLMTRLYRELFAGSELGDALRRGRWELSKQKRRRAYHNQFIDLEDWLLPVAYQNQPARFALREFTPAEREEFFKSEAHAFPFPEPAYGFFGRDLDVLEIEKRLLSPDGGPRNLLLVRGMGGAGKTTLLR
ncbi:MAG: CHAT domain-containing protein, partial [Chloroflexi bacterium]